MPTPEGHQGYPCVLKYLTSMSDCRALTLHRQSQCLLVLLPVSTRASWASFPDYTLACWAVCPAFALNRPERIILFYLDPASKSRLVRPLF